MKKFHVILAGFILLGILLGVGVGILNGKIPQDMFTLPSRAELEAGGSGYIEPALNLLEHGTMYPDNYSSRIRRGPVFPSLIAASFLIFGKNKIAIWILNLIFFILSVLVLYTISKMYFNGRWALVPPALLSVYPGFYSLIINDDTEFLAMFLLLSFVFFFLRYKSTVLHSTGMALAAGLLTIERPEFLYLLPLLLIFFVVKYVREHGWKNILTHTLITLTILIFVIGGWMLYNKRMIGDPKLGDSGVIMMLSVVERAGLPLKRLAVYWMGFTFGNLITDQFFPGYAKNSEPWETRRLLHERFDKEVSESGFTKQEVDEKFGEEAIAYYKEHPLRFILGGIVGVFILHSPVNYEGADISKLFVGTFQEIPLWIKIGIILVIRLVWYSFLALVVWGMVQGLKNWRRWGLFLLASLYFVGIFSFFTHAETRYLLRVVPFYFLFFTLSLMVLWKKHTKKSITI